MTDAGLLMGGYRFLLRRNVTETGFDKPRRILFVMLNPSTATDDEDDPTIRRCIGFAQRWEYATLEVVNLFAMRATRPAALKRAANPISPPTSPRHNDNIILERARVSDLIICAWGPPGALYRRGEDVSEMLTKDGSQLHCLSLTKGGYPRHPLMAPYTLGPVLYREAVS